MTSRTSPRREGFVCAPGAAVWARVPLAPAASLTERHAAAPLGPLLAEGLFLTSRHLEVEGQHGAAEASTYQRMAATRRAYELRARHRCVPSGVFAGVSPATAGGPVSSMTVGTAHRPRTNPAPGWLSLTCSLLLAEECTFDTAIFTTCPATTRRGSRLEVEGQAAGDAGAGPGRVTVAATAVTELILTRCGRGASGGQLIETIRGAWPQATPELIRDTVTTLAADGFLLSDLLPADVTDDPLAWLVKQLPAHSRHREALTGLRDLLHRADQQPPGCPGRLTLLRQARQVADQVIQYERPLIVDTVADARIHLADSLLADAAQAAGVLAQVSSGPDPLDDYHARFVERYGPHRPVPLHEVVDPTLGLGAPTLSQRADRGPQHLQHLAHLLGRALAAGQREIVLADADVISLTPAGDQELPPSSAEVYAYVIADSDQDRDQGRFQLAITAITHTAGSSLGRFASLLPADPPGPAWEDDSQTCEITVRTRVAEVAALAPPTGWAVALPIDLPDGPDTDTIPAADVLIVSDGARLHAWSERLGRRLAPMLFSRLTSRFLPPAAHLLRLIGEHGRPWQDWEWGALAALPYQPRVRYGATILAPARWRLPAALIASATSAGRWEEALDAWRAEGAYPPDRVVVTAAGDRRLPLDLERPEDRQLLRRYVRRGLTAVTEQPGGPAATRAVVAGPDGHHAVEVVIPLAYHRPVASRPLSQDRLAAARPRATHLHLPGGSWLSCVLPAAPAQHDDLLTALSMWLPQVNHLVDHWFYLRYDDPRHGPHLRVRFHGQPHALSGQVLPALSAWASDMIAQRLLGDLTLASYDPEIERYGGPDAIGLAEAVFAADSQLVLATVAALLGGQERIVFAAHTAALIARILADTDPQALTGRHLDRAGRNRVNALRPAARAAGHDPAGHHSTEGLPGGAHRPALIAALNCYRERLDPERRAGAASAVIHMHANRLGLDPATEPLARALAADLIARRDRRHD
ncbi:MULTISPECIES: lantibiotic dehydratase [unclassified Nonomuraea]|uniref:lantibiotic dehydratase n=1 Tax=unclassified Nonomuraea TaxID=2593643 RepID=UPI003409A314